MLLIVLFLLCSAALGDEQPRPLPGHYYHPTNHGTTVCIEIRPPGHHSAPTKVCGPVVHGGMSQQTTQPQALQQQQQQPKSDGALAAMPETQRGVEPTFFPMEGEPKDASGAPCNRGMGRPGGPLMIPRMVGDSMMSLGQPMEMDGGMGWRQATPPCPHDQMMRSMPPPVIAAPVMPFSPGRAYMPNMVPRTWFTHPGLRSAEEQEPSAKSTQDSKEDFEHLLKECEEKTMMLKEKEKEIAELKKISETKKEIEKPNNVKNQNSAPMKN